MFSYFGSVQLPIPRLDLYCGNGLKPSFSDKHQRSSFFGGVAWWWSCHIHDQQLLAAVAFHNSTWFAGKSPSFPSIIFRACPICFPLNIIGMISSYICLSNGQRVNPGMAKSRFRRCISWFVEYKQNLSFAFNRVCISNVCWLILDINNQHKGLLDPAMINGFYISPSKCVLVPFPLNTSHPTDGAAAGVWGVAGSQDGGVTNGTGNRRCSASQYISINKVGIQWNSTITFKFKDNYIYIYRDRSKQF